MLARPRLRFQVSNIGWPRVKRLANLNEGCRPAL